MADWRAGLTCQQIADKWNVSYGYASKSAERGLAELRIYRVKQPLRDIDALVDRRKAIGMSRYRLAKVIGIDRASVRRWELGEYAPTEFNLLCWRQALGVGP